MARRVLLSDALHRGFVLGLAGLTAGAFALGVATHLDTISRGKELMAAIERNEVQPPRKKGPADAIPTREDIAIAEAAQAALRSDGTRAS